MDMSKTFINQKGNYRKLAVFRKAECIYDITHVFTRRFLSSRDRTVDQMVQAARSGKQNIAEGSKASMTSRETEIKLLNVARASLEELLLDYEDYLRVRRLPQWSKEHPRMEALRRLCAEQDDSSYYLRIAEICSDEELANMAITHIHQADYLFERLIKKVEAQFLENGGLREQMYQARLDYRSKHGGKAGN